MSDVQEFEIAQEAARISTPKFLELARTAMARAERLHRIRLGPIRLSHLEQDGRKLIVARAQRIG